MGQGWGEGGTYDVTLRVGLSSHWPQGVFWANRASSTKEICRLYMNYAFGLLSCILEDNEIIWCFKAEKVKNKQTDKRMDGVLR